MRRKKHKTKKRRPALAEQPEDRGGYKLPPRWWVGRDRDVGQIVVRALRWQREWMDA